MKTVVHLTSVHSPFDVRIFHKECISLQREGYRVVIIACYDGVEERAGVLIRGVGNSKNRIGRMTKILWKIFRQAIKEKGDIYHFHDPELIPVGMLLKLHGKKVIYDIHEHVPRQILQKEWLSTIVRKPVAWIINLTELVAARMFDRLSIAWSAIGDRFPENKVVLIRNYPTDTDLTIQNGKMSLDDPPSIVFFGNVTEERGIMEMIKSVELVNQERKATLKIAGKFKLEQTYREAQKLSGWRYVDYLGWLNREDLFNLASRARIGLVITHPTANYIESIAIKLFEYMAAGLPVVASNFPSWVEVVDKHKCGITVDPFNIYKVAQAIEWLLEHADEASAMGNRGKAAVKEYYMWEYEEQKLLDMYKILSATPSGKH